MNITKKTESVTRIDLLNADSSSTPFKKAVGKGKFKIRAVATGTKEVDGEEKPVSYFFTDDGQTFGGISETVKRSADNMIDIFTDDPNYAVAVSFEKTKTNSDRECILAHFEEL